MSSAGIMNKDFFVSKRVLLNWLSDFFQVNYTKVEEAATGAIHCQILDAIFPGKVPLHKVNFNATQEYQFVQNYKILQSVFIKENITRHVDVQKLIKAKYQDNLEFLQWMKHFFETRYTGQPYNAVQRREECQSKFSKGKKFNTNSSAPSADTKQKITPKESAKENSNPNIKTTQAKTKTKVTSEKALVSSTRPTQRSTTRNVSSTRTEPTKTKSSNAEKALKTQVIQLRLTVEGLEKERDFYYNKLREVEILCSDENQDAQYKPMLSKILEILYREDEDFEQPDADDVVKESEGTPLAVEVAPVEAIPEVDNNEPAAVVETVAEPIEEEAPEEVVETVAEEEVVAEE